MKKGKLFSSTGLIDNRYISAIRSQTDQVYKRIAAYIGEVYPVGLCQAHLTGRFCAYMQRVLGRTGERVLGAFGFFLNNSKPLDFAEGTVESQGSLI